MLALDMFFSYTSQKDKAWVKRFVCKLKERREYKSHLIDYFLDDIYKKSKLSAERGENVLGVK